MVNIAMLSFLPPPPLTKRRFPVCCLINWINLFVTTQVALSSFSQVHLCDSITCARRLPYKKGYQRGAFTTEERAVGILLLVWSSW